ncbi:MAG: exopolysaccharide biosynthesis protein, partial [Rhodobacteraceae bacterium]|nr:exopolysaccharide biosynthesis protein [Paracoccaceae bacterium]
MSGQNHDRPDDSAPGGTDAGAPGGTDAGGPDPFDRLARESHAAARAPVSPFRGPPVPPRHTPGTAMALAGAGLPMVVAPHDPGVSWARLPAVTPDRDILAARGLGTPDGGPGPAAARFDLLRTRMLRALDERGWRRVIVTAPTRGCGTSLVAAGLALSLARLPEQRGVLLDLELRAPGLARMLGVAASGPIAPMLQGEAAPADHLVRIGRNLGLGLSDSAVAEPPALLHAAAMAHALDAIARTYEPDAVLCDMPPMLACDDVLALLPRVDCVLIVADATRTTAADLRACETMLEGRAPILGVVLNRAEDTARRYRYD